MLFTMLQRRETNLSQSHTIGRVHIASESLDVSALSDAWCVIDGSDHTKQQGHLEGAGKAGLVRESVPSTCFWSPRECSAAYQLPLPRPPLEAGVPSEKQRLLFERNAGLPHGAHLGFSRHWGSK